MDTDIQRPDPRLRVFPAARDVFVQDQPWLADHLHPLVSIDLAALDPDWDGWLHMVTPLEPCEGYVGDHSKAFHNAFTRENWLAFHREDDGRYRFLGDRSYFVLEQASPQPGEWEGLREYVRAHYARQRASFAASVHRYARDGVLTFPDRSDPLARSEWGGESNLLDQLGGGTGDSNWVGSPPIPEAFELDANDSSNVFPRMKDGTPFRFIASVAGYPWQGSGADAILLFYEPVSRTVLLTFDWT